MSELAAPLRQVLERTGYLTEGAPAAASVRLAGAGDLIRPPSFAPEAWWRSNPDATAQYGTATAGTGGGRTDADTVRCA